MRNTGMKLSLLTMVLYSITLFISDTRTHAGFWENLYNGYEQYSKLPEEVNQLQQSYEQTMNELNSAKQNMEAFQERNEDLIKQNEELMKQNDNLNQLVSQMQQAEADRKVRSKKSSIRLLLLSCSSSGILSSSESFGSECAELQDARSWQDHS